MCGQSQHIMLTNGQVTLDNCVHIRLRDRLRKASMTAHRTERPILLYRLTLEENDNSAEEEIATVTEQHIIVQVITHGGFIPPHIQQQFVFTIDSFSEWVTKRSGELLSCCLEALDKEFID